MAESTDPNQRPDLTPMEEIRGRDYVIPGDLEGLQALRSNTEAAPAVREWELDERTKDLGRKGVAAARQQLDK